MAMREKRKLTETFVGKLGMNLRLFGEDARSTLTNAAIISAIALQGPSWPFQIHNRANRILSDASFPSEMIPSADSTFYRRIEDLTKREYISGTERAKAIPGAFTGKKDAKVYDLSAKGSIVALIISNVYNRLPDFLKWRNSDGRLRLDGLRFISLMIDRGITRKLWEKILKEALRKTLVLDFEMVSQEEARDMFYACIVTAMVSTFGLKDRKEQREKLDRLGITDNEYHKFKLFYTRDPEVEKMLIDYKEAIQEMRTEVFPGMERTLTEAIDSLQEKRKGIAKSLTSVGATSDI